MSEFAQLENTAAAILQEKNRQARREKLLLKIFLLSFSAVPPNRNLDFELKHNNLFQQSFQ